MIHSAPDHRRLSEMYKTDKEYNALSCFQLQKHPYLTKRYFEVASVMHDKGKFPFLHAQSSAYRAGRIFIETLSGDSQKKSHFKYFRQPSSKFFINRDQLMEKVLSSIEPASHIMSMSYSIFECEPEESANYFLFRNSSASNDLKNSEEAIEVCLKRRGMQARKPDVSKKIQQFVKEYSKLKLGTLYLVGIPKERLSRYVYDSYPYGKPTGIDIHQVIDRDAFSLEKASIQRRAPQARLMLFNETMTPSSGIEVVDVTDVEESVRYIEDHRTTPPETGLPYSYFFPEGMAQEDEDGKQRERIDAQVRQFAKMIANL